MKALRFCAAFFALSALAAINLAQSSSVDPTFGPVPSVKFSNEDALGKSVLVQPDGKLVIWGGNFAIDGVAKGQLARLNTDGTLDSTFTYCSNCIKVGDVAVQPDGKLLVSGTEYAHAKMIRLNPDGTQDNSFVSNFTADTGFISSGASIVKLQPDGKILASVNGAYCCGYHGRALTRLNTDGSTDSGFTSINYDSGRLVSTALTALVLDPSSGKFYMATVTYSGGTFSALLKRYNANGTPDNSFETPSIAPSLQTAIYGLALQADGGLLISGQFDAVNGVGKHNIVRLMAAGNVDLNFTAPTLGSSAQQIAVLQSGKILVGYDVTGQKRMARLKTDGSLDETFVLSPSVGFISSNWTLDSTERILFFGFSVDESAYRYFRLNPNGDKDPAFNPNVTIFGKIYSLARQADGKILMAGKFTQVNGFARASLARVNADGTLDPTLDVGNGFDAPPNYLSPQSDGKIIVAGPFTSVNGIPRPGIARMTAEGAVDLAFSPTLSGGSQVTAAALQADGKVLIAGNFTTVDGIARTGVARLNSNGTLDNSFNPTFAPGMFVSILQQPDGNIVVSGTFSGVNGFNRSNAVRLTSIGELDQSFNATGIGSGLRTWLQPDGKYIFTGAGIARRNTDGSVDSSFTPPSFDSTDSYGRYIDAVIFQPDGSLIVGGRFDLVGSVTRHNIVRLTATGALDLLFFPTGTDGEIRAAVAQPDGKLIIGGDFSKVESVTKPAVARLSIVPFRRATPFDFDGDGRADISVVRTSTNRWYEALSSTGNVHEETFGLAGDLLAPADFDGDGITDEAIYRPSNGQWWFRSSLNGSLVLNQFGNSGYIPRPSDFDGDGKADLVLFNPGNNVWYRFSSLTQQATTTSFGLAGDQPLVGDFDGDGKSDLAIFRPSNGDWWYAASSAGGAFRTAHWGQNGDIPVPADYDGDGKTDYAVFRPSDGGWYIYNSGNGSFTTTAFGISTDRPVAADYDGDGRADIAVFRPSTGIWYLLRSTSGFAGYQFGISTDIAIPGALIP